MSTTNTEDVRQQAADSVEDDLKGAFIRSCNALKVMAEPTNDLVTVRDYLRDAANKDRVSKDPTFAKFLYELCAP